METVTLRLTREMRHSLERMAQAADITPGQVVRDLIGREVTRRHRARPPVRADERLLAPLRARLASDLAEARDWQDLAGRLQQKGYVLRESGGGLALYSWPSGARVCKASELGFSYGRLMQRFRAPFPGHAHTWLADKLLASATEYAHGADFEVIKDVIERD
ncbi:MAG: hypothetical protein ACWA5A_19205 [Marinibacterium sp.]